MSTSKDKNISRRSFLKLFGGGSVAAAAVLAGCKQPNKAEEQAVNEYKNQVEPPTGKMTYRENPTTKDKVSLLGYGMMRLPMKPDTEEFDQEQINRLVDYAMEHGVNYYDTSPVYCRGESEKCTGIALKKYPRDKFFVATKLSNFNSDYHSFEKSKEMYHNSMKELQVDYIDYYLLHSVGGGGMEEFSKRYIDNGIMDYLLEERKAGRIRNLGFSFHGDIKVFDWLMEQNDKYHWDFVQIELNYLDWNFADEFNKRNTDASYLYSELWKRGIPSVIMEPLLGGRLASLPQFLVSELKGRDPEKSVASWAFRYAGTPEGVLTVLSGMTYMEHLKDNLLSYCPLAPLNEKEQRYLDTDIAQKIFGLENIPCNDCQYCMPCPYGIDIPAIFVHYNKCKNEGSLPYTVGDAEYRKHRRQYLISLDRAVPRDRQPDHCIQCGQCEPHCPQNIRIPHELRKIDEFIENLKRHPDGFEEKA